jgi:hypothetical protein
MPVTRWLCGVVACALLLPLAASAQDALAGKRLYLDVSRLRGTGVSCVDCHGGLPGGVFGIGRAANDAAAVERAVNSIPQMTPLRGRLSGSDFADLAAYIGRPSVPSPVLRSATNGPAVTGSTSRLDFGAVATGTQTAASRWHIVNDGAVGLQITGMPQLRGDHPQDFVLIATDCAAGPLAAGASCSVDLAFRPLAAAGARQAAVAVAHDWVGGEVAIALGGVVAAAPPAMPPVAASSAGGGGGSAPWLLWMLPVALAGRCWLGGLVRVRRSGLPRRPARPSRSGLQESFQRSGCPR